MTTSAYNDRHFKCGVQDSKGDRRYVSSIGVAGQYEYSDDESAAKLLSSDEVVRYIHHCEDVTSSQWFVIYKPVEEK